MSYELRKGETTYREVIWICLYCESSNYSEYHVCEVCTNERIYTHEEVAEMMKSGGLRTGKIDLNPWYIGTIAFLLLLLLISWS